MSIIDIQSVSSSKINDRPVRITPIFLVWIEEPKAKIQKFLAVKLDELQSGVKMIGVDTSEDADTLIINYNKYLSSIDKSLVKEVTVPWQRIIRIQNLIYKYK